MSYATEVWSPSHPTLKQKAERVQRRATRWILQIKQGELSYKETDPSGSATAYL